MRVRLILGVKEQRPGFQQSASVPGSLGEGALEYEAAYGVVVSVRRHLKVGRVFRLGQRETGHTPGLPKRTDKVATLEDCAQGEPIT
jgi:hypothetical protein